MDDNDYEFETRQIHAGYEPDEQVGDHRYARMSGPTRDALTERVADLEGRSRGHTFASGMAAINAVCTAVLSSDDHVVAGANLYAESHTRLTRIFSTFGVDVTLVVESLTKYVPGHSDAMAGAVVTDDPALDEAIETGLS